MSSISKLVQGLHVFTHPYGIESKGRIKLKWQFLVVILVLLVAVLRVGFPFPNYLAIDDTVYFHDAQQQSSSSLFTPYAGYMQLLCRFLAYCYHFFSPQNVLLLYFLSPIVMLGLVSLFILNQNWIAKIRRIIFALSTIILPSQSEVFTRFCDTNWIASLVLLFILFAPELGKANPIKTWAYVILTAIIGLSNPYVAILSPCFAVRWLSSKKKSGGELLLLSTIIFVSAIQTWIVLRSGLTMNNTNQIGVSAFNPIFNPFITWFNALAILPISCYLTSCSLLQKAVHNYRIFIPLLLVILFLVSAISYLWLKSNKTTKTNFLTWFGVGYYLIVLCSFRMADTPQLYLAMKGADRYFYLPYFCFSAALAEILLASQCYKHRQYLKTLILIPLCIFFLYEFRISYNKDEGWHDQLQKLQATGHWDYNPHNGILMHNQTDEIE